MVEACTHFILGTQLLLLLLLLFFFCFSFNSESISENNLFLVEIVL